jgi:hypothetical protein
MNGYEFFCEIPIGCAHQWQKSRKLARPCVSNFFGRNKRVTLAIKRKILWCRSHYQTNAYQTANWKFQRLGLIREQAIRIDEDDEALYTITLKNEEAERINSWYHAGIDMPTKDALHHRGQTFRSPIWALRFIENEWVGVDMPLDSVLDFVQWTTEMLASGRLNDIPMIEFLPQFDKIRITLQKAQVDSIARAKARGHDEPNDVHVPDTASEAEQMDREDSMLDAEGEDVDMEDADLYSDATISAAGDRPSFDRRGSSGRGAQQQHAQSWAPVNGQHFVDPAGTYAAPLQPTPRVYRPSAAAAAQQPTAPPPPQRGRASFAPAPPLHAGMPALAGFQLMPATPQYAITQQYAAATAADAAVGHLTAAAHMVLGARSAVSLAATADNGEESIAVGALSASLGAIERALNSAVQRQRGENGVRRGSGGGLAPAAAAPNGVAPSSGVDGRVRRGRGGAGGRKKKA